MPEREGERAMVQSQERCCRWNAGGDIYLEVFRDGGTPKSSSCGRATSAVEMCGETPFMSRVVRR